MATLHKVRLLFVICCLIGVIVTAIVVPIVVTNSNKSSAGGSDTEAESGDCSFRTQTQGGWGTTCSGNNPGCYRDDHFCGCFPQGIAIGCGPVGKWLKFTSTTAVKAFLPKGGSPSVLTVKAKNPLSSDAGTDGSFAGNLLAAKLNVGFDVCDPNFSSCSTNTSSLCFKDSSVCNGYNIAQVIVAADYIIGGCGTVLCTSVAPATLCNLSPSTIASCLDVFNNNYDGGTTNLGKIGFCSSGSCKSS
jgi:hypothetical protein